MPSVLDAGPTRPGPERPLVERDREHRRVVREQRLRAVSMVNVEVDDGDSLEPELELRVAGGNGDVREDAEAHRSRLERVVPRRPNQREPAARDGLDRAPGGKTRRLPGRRGGVRVGIEPDLARDRLDRVDVTRGVHDLDPVLGAGSPTTWSGKRSRSAWRRPGCSSLPLDSGAWRVANDGWLITSTSAPPRTYAQHLARRAPSRERRRSPSPARHPEAAAAAPRDPWSRSCGRDEALPPRS